MLKIGVVNVSCDIQRGDKQADFLLSDIVSISINNMNSESFNSGTGRKDNTLLQTSIYVIDSLIDVNSNNSFIFTPPFMLDISNKSTFRSRTLCSKS